MAEAGQTPVKALLIMASVLFEVALWQWRVVITVRGNSFGGALLGFVGALVQVTVIAQVVQDGVGRDRPR